jgi:signal transduction histidine kinase
MPVETNPMGVLIVDGDSEVCERSARILESMGLRPLTAENGEGGLSLLKAESVSISIVLLESKLPDMDGLTLLRHIRECHADILVIMTTNSATIETAVAAIKQGACDFIAKPLEPDQLRLVIHRAQEQVRRMGGVRKMAPRGRRIGDDLHTEIARLHAIVDSLPNGVMVTSPLGEVILMNPAFIQLLELSPGISPGQNFCEIVTDQGLCDLIMSVCQGNLPDFDPLPSYEYEFSLGEDKFLLARGKPVLDEHQACLGAVINVVDVTTLKVLDRLKTEFVAKVSHELRSPLATIHEQLTLVLSDIVGRVSDSNQHLLSRAKEKTQGLISTIGDLLDLSRIESGMVAQELEPVQLEELLQNIVDFLGIQAQNRQQALTLEIPAEALPALKADPLALESIFGNLISNAINYTGEGGQIQVIADLSGINLRVRVIDNGFGIEERHLDRIFQRFYRVKTDRTRYITGTGLGLPIVKGLVDSLGGSIRVESIPEKGSTFTVLLPVER